MADAGIPTFHYGNVLVTLMHEVLTHAEKSLTETGQIDAVSHIRRAVHPRRTPGQARRRLIVSRVRSAAA